jgi:5-methylcytosine-specific restriction enzyme A
MSQAAPKFRPPQAPTRQGFDRWRGSAAQRGYDHAWTLLRQRKVRQDPLCEDCLLEGRTTPAAEVDHVIPIAKDPSLRLEISNLRSLCKSHHVRKTRRDQGA